jgi:hypothetical protein
MSKVWIVRTVAMVIYVVVGAVLLILNYSWVHWVLPIFGLVVAVAVWLITDRLEPPDDLDLGEREPWFEHRSRRKERRE